MTDDADFRSLLATMLEDQPPTRLTADQLVRAGRRRARWARWLLPPPPADGPYELPRPDRPRRSTARLATGWGTTVAATIAAGLAVASLVSDSPGGTNQLGNVQLSRDGRVLSADGQLTGRDGCAAAVKLVADETTSEVRLSLAPDPPPVTQLTCIKGPIPVRVQLTRPLGDRRVRFGADGPLLPVFDLRRAAAVGYLPPGFVDGFEWCAPLVQLGPGTSVHADGPVRQCTASYRKELSPTLLTGVSLAVRQYFRPVAAPPVDPSEPVWDPPRAVLVHGQQAQLRLGRVAQPGRPMLSWQLTWSERGETIELRASGVDQLNLLPSTAELVRIADGLRW
ncbi:MAG TPA: hypothetical protein VMU51_27755 [Mycobacteriales bacterium]|nr:hypothetical protein [Mycobacteriales bacterium]